MLLKNTLGLEVCQKRFCNWVVCLESWLLTPSVLPNLEHTSPGSHQSRSGLLHCPNSPLTASPAGDKCLGQRERAHCTGSARRAHERHTTGPSTITNITLPCSQYSGIHTWGLVRLIIIGRGLRTWKFQGAFRGLGNYGRGLGFTVVPVGCLFSVFLYSQAFEDQTNINQHDAMKTQ